LQWTKRKEQYGTSTLPFEYNTATKTYSPVERSTSPTSSQGGPDSQQNRERMTYNLSTTSAGAMSGRPRRRLHLLTQGLQFNTATSDQFDPSTTRQPRHPAGDPLNEDGGALQIDTLAELQSLPGA